MLNSHQIAQKLGFVRTADEMPADELMKPKSKPPVEDEAPEADLPPLPPEDPAAAPDDLPPLPDEAGEAPVDKIEHLRQVLLAAIGEESTSLD